MKCIKAVKESKHKVGEIIRISNVDAEERIKTGYWEYVSKSQWKEYKNPKEVEVKTSNETGKPLKKNQKTKETDKKSKNLKKK